MNGLLRNASTYILAIAVSVWFLVDANTPSTVTNTASDKNQVTITGSTALQPLLTLTADKFVTGTSDLSLLVQGGGSQVGLTQVAQGRVHIGSSDFSATDITSIDSQALVNNKVAVIGVAIVVNPAVGITNLTTQQTIDIFTRKVTNWRQVGGPDLHIMLISRSRTSGTRATFKEHVLNGVDEADSYALVQDSSESARKLVANIKGAIGYLAIPYVDESVQKVSLNGVAANADNIINGSYPVWSYGYLITKGQPAGPAKAFIDYMRSDEVQSLVATAGYVPLGKMSTAR